MIDDMPKREDLPNLTKKQLAEYIYDFYIEINVTDPKNGVGKEEWVRRMLKGAGAAQPAKKDELVRQLSSILEDRENDMHYIDAVIEKNGLERLKSRVDVVKQFSKNTLETELDARDATSIMAVYAYPLTASEKMNELDASLSKISTRELSEIVEEYRAYKRPYASQIVANLEVSEAASKSTKAPSKLEMQAKVKELASEAERLVVFANRIDLSKYRLDALKIELSEREQGKHSEGDLMIYSADDLKAVIKDYEVYRSDEAAAYHKEWVERNKTEALNPQAEAVKAPGKVPQQRQNLKAQLGKYNAEELQKFLAKELEESALKSEKSYKEFIEFLAGFRSSRYSSRNQLMLYIQSAQQGLLPVFGTFDEWKERNTSIKSGEKGLTICRPLFSDVYYDLQELVPSPSGKMVPQRLLKFTLTPEKIAELEAGIKNGTVQKETELTSFYYVDSVFSMSQTTMQEQDRIEYLQRYNATNTSEENADLYAKLIDVSAALGRNVKERDIQDESLGWVERVGDEIAIKKDMPTDSKCSVLAHEIGHTLLHIRNDTAEGKAQKEVQAQLFSHIAMLKLGIDAEKQFSLHYINSYLKSGARSAPMFDANGNELSPGQVLQVNLNAVLPAVDLLVQTVGEKMQPIDKDSLQKLQGYTAERPHDAKPSPDRLKEHKVEIEPLRIFKQTDKAALVKLSGATAGSKTPVWLPKSQISINKDGFVNEATPTLIKNKGLTPKASLSAKMGLGRKV